MRNRLPFKDKCQMMLICSAKSNQRRDRHFASVDHIDSQLTSQKKGHSDQYPPFGGMDLDIASHSGPEDLARKNPKRLISPIGQHGADSGHEFQIQPTDQGLRHGQVSSEPGIQYCLQLLL